MTEKKVTTMSYEQMAEIIKSAKPGDKLKLDFANKTFNGDLKGRLYMILAMQGRTIQFGEMSILTLSAVVNSGKWERFQTHSITILEGFDHEYFISRTLGREMLDGVSLG